MGVGNRERERERESVCGCVCVCVCVCLCVCACVTFSHPCLMANKRLRCQKDFSKINSHSIEGREREGGREKGRESSVREIHLTPNYEKWYGHGNF